ncbi:hypothetical protein TNIN_478871 [Trichonephila inaurata madagascariensis]|uniref:Uncharacterized protein n=1 Tax=Trichonephila inaurata madagascariensis TaxID=2747483 RepID=A0A8X6YGL9_9ARAC|nr:hypothetical protein TNIN_478871 [Trichonephila inaurata madagascariensis]
MEFHTKNKTREKIQNRITGTQLKYILEKPFYNCRCVVSSTDREVYGLSYSDEEFSEQILPFGFLRGCLNSNPIRLTTMEESTLLVKTCLKFKI